MNWGEHDNSFGNPPTPTRTPTSASPNFQTPRNKPDFENRTGWTPTFAEEYSVFHATPGRLTGNHSFEASTPRPSTASSQNQHFPTIDDPEAEFSIHMQHNSPNSNITALNSSHQFTTSPNLLSPTHNRFHDISKPKVTPRLPKKRLDEAFSGQTATPPASVTKGSRKLAPKKSKGTMQNDSQDSQYGNSQTQTQNLDFMSYPSTSGDFFYPMPAPATAPAYSNAKSFWDPDASMGGMDLDFTTDDAGMFTTSIHHVSNPPDWEKDDQMFQDSLHAPAANYNLPQSPVVAKRQRPLAPKLPTALIPLEFNANTTSGDPFSALSFDGGVDPGLLFSLGASASLSRGLETAPESNSRPTTSHIDLTPYQHQIRDFKRDQEDIRRSRSSRDTIKTRRADRNSISSPTKSSRPDLQRSVSDNRGKRPPDRILSRTGRISPVKHSRPNSISLSSIPELPPPRIRTEVKFTIDANGRARTETVLVEEETTPPRTGSSRRNDRWDEESNDESSSDEDPILVPSRNTSFALPTQKPPRLAKFDTIRATDVRRHSTSGYSRSDSSSQRSTYQGSVESEAETVVDEDTGFGDAALELRKVVKSRKNQMKLRNPQHHRYGSNSTPHGISQYVYSSSTNISPTTITDPDGATPSSSRSGTTRCVCSKPDNEGFMIQCESCDNWLHAECVGIDQRSLPPVYICAFCAQTPNMRGGRIREPARIGGAQMGSSPLAHKTFRSFR